MFSMARLNGKIAIVTGASSGIGRAAALRFAAEGARLVLVARGAEALDTLCAEIGEAALACPGDVCDEATAERAVALAEARFGGLDIAFNNAGATSARDSLPGLDAVEWHRMLDTNLTSAFLGARHQLPAMQRRGGGSLIFTSSFVGVGAGFPGMLAYGAAKSGLLGLVRGLAVAHGGEGIRANALVVGGTDTEMNPARAPDADPGMLDYIGGLHALRRIAEPEEIAQAALFLASDEASFVTGAAFAVDGGASITKT
jgi:NAD(P)-dependent dehydrogenase (short-subunit alcohol dehydrogenase family)